MVGLRHEKRYPILVTVRLSDSDAAKLRTLCQANNLTTGEVMRAGLRSLPDAPVRAKQRRMR